MGGFPRSRATALSFKVDPGQRSGRQPFGGGYGASLRPFGRRSHRIHGQSLSGYSGAAHIHMSPVNCRWSH